MKSERAELGKEGEEKTVSEVSVHKKQRDGDGNYSSQCSVRETEVNLDI